MKTTRQDFELFQKCCRKWQNEFELNNWKLYFFHEKTGNKGQIVLTQEGYVASVTLGTDWEHESVTPEEIDDTARHEMIHLLLGRMSENGKNRYVDVDDIYNAEEETVRKIERIVSKLTTK